MYGTQTQTMKELRIDKFENDVKMYGTQTDRGFYSHYIAFENDVKMYGTQTGYGCCTSSDCLRMM